MFDFWKHHIKETMRKRIFARITAGLLCGALLFTDAASIGVRASSSDTDMEQTVALTESDNEDVTSDPSVDDEEKETKKEETTEEKAEETSGEEKLEEETTGSESTEEGETEGADEKEENPGTETEQPEEPPKEEEPSEEELPKEDIPQEEQTQEPEEETEENTEKPGQTEDEPEGETVAVEESVSENATAEIDAVADSVVMAEGDIASGEINEDYGHIAWVINADGKLTVRGTGDYSSHSAFRPPWLQYKDYITEAAIDITEITRTTYILSGCSNMTNVDVSKLDTSKVTTMCNMFSGCKGLMRLDVANFDTSQVTDMSYMFSNCSSLTQLTGSHFTTDQVVNMSNMFSGCSSLEKLDLSHFNNSHVQNMCQMFYGCSSLTNLNLSFFNTSQVTTMEEMFRECRSLTELDLSYFNTGQVENMHSMFMICDSLKELNLSSFNTENVTNMGWMFYKCSSMTDLNLSGFNINKVSNISNMFGACQNLLELDLSSFGANQSTDMSYMFNGCNSLTKLDLRYLNTSQVTSMLAMFEGCRSLRKLDLNHFDTGQVKNMNYMFSECKSLEFLNLSHFDTSNVTQAGSMFSECSTLTALDLSSFDFSKITSNQWLTMDCLSLTRIDTPYNINVSLYLSGRTWYTSDGVEVTEMPKNLDHSVALGLNHIPSVEKPVIPPEDDDPEEEYISKQEKYVRDVTQYSLANASDDEKKKVWDGLYDVMFKAYYRPIGYDPDNVVFFGGSKDFIVNWKPQNSDSDDSTITDKNLGEIKYENSARGCLSYAHFVSKYVHGTNGERSNEKYRCWVSRDTKEKPEESQKAVENLIHTYADPGETIGFFIEGGKCIHYVVYLGESKDGTGFDCISYGGGRYEDENGNIIAEDHTIAVERYTYKEFVDKFVKSKGANRFIVWDTNDGLLSGQTDTKIENPAATKIQVACPVEAIVELNGEKLDSRVLGTASFGSVSRDGEQITFDLTYSPNYSLQILGTGEGAMTVTLTYYDGTGKQINQRKFVNVPVTASTEVESGGFNHIADFVLYVSEKDKELSAWGAGPGETVYAPNDDFLPDSSFEYVGDDESGVHYKDIPDSGEIPQGLWISAIPDCTYTGTAIKPEVRVYDGEKRLKLNKDYTNSYKNNTKAAQSGDAKPPTVVVKGKGNYSGTETQTFNITKRDIADDCVIKSFTDAYAPMTNGKNPKLVFSAKCNKKTLKKNTDYTLTVIDAGGNETDAYATEGTYSVLLKGVGTNYTGECVLSFDVLNKIPVSKLKVNKIASVEYDGTSKRSQPIVKYGKVTLRKGTDYSLYYRNNREMGTATIEITGKGDYFGTKNVTFAITGRQIKKVKFSGFKSSFPYTGDTVYQSGAALKYGEEELALGTDYTVSYNNHLNKGKATVTYIGLGNYTGTLKKTYSIAAYNIAADAENRISLSTDEISAVYEKGGAKPSVKVYDGTRLLAEGKDYTLSYQNHTAVTTQATEKQPTITVRGKGNYAGVLAQKKTFTITPKAFTEVTVTAPDVTASPKIGKYKSMPVLTDTNGKKLKAGTDYEKTYTYTYKNTTAKVLNGESEVTRNAGDPVDENDIIPANTILCVGIRAREGGNYIGEKTAEYRIVTSPISKAKITVQNPSQNNKNLFTYTGQEIRIDKSNLTVKVGTDILTDDQYEILEDTYKNNINKGTASVQIRGVGTVYGGTATVKFKIGTKGFQWFWRLFG